jgi:hypothetical protein
MRNLCEWKPEREAGKGSIAVAGLKSSGESGVDLPPGETGFIL